MAGEIAVTPTVSPAPEKGRGFRGWVGRRWTHWRAGAPERAQRREERRQRREERQLHRDQELRRREANLVIRDEQRARKDERRAARERIRLQRENRRIAKQKRLKLATDRKVAEIRGEVTKERLERTGREKTERDGSRGTKPVRVRPNRRTRAFNRRRPNS